MDGKLMKAVALAFLCAMALGGCASLGDLGGSAAAPGGPAVKAEPLAAAIGKTPPGGVATALAPQGGAAVEVRVESEYLSGAGEVCRRATLPGRRGVTACRGRDGWAMIMEIHSSTMGGQR